MFESLKINELPESNVGIIRKPSNTRPTIWLVEENGVQAAVKDFSRNGFFFRNVVGRFLIWRERKAYSKLKGIQGIPRLYRVIEGLALVLEHIPGKNVEELEDSYKIPSAFYEALEDLVGRFHKLGIAHCDLKRAPNIMVGPNGDPYVVDWSASISAKEFSLFPLNLIYEQFIFDDLKALIKLKMRHSPETVTRRERIEYQHMTKAEKLLRPIRDKLRSVLKKIA